MQVLEFNKMKYVIRFPKDYKEGESYPTIIFFHGAGTRGGDTNLLAGNEFFTQTAKFEDFPFVSIAPLCDGNSWFDKMETLIAFSKFILTQDYCDEERLYLIGNSMGGYATWQLAMSAPELFAAIIPICGGGMYWNAAQLVNVPIWAFHGGLDPAVFPEESKKMVDAVNRRGGSAKLTIYPENGHNAWSDTYKNYEVFEFLLSHKNENAKALVNDFNDMKLFG